MTKLTDETLMAYVDGQLGPREAKEVEAMLTTDAATAAKVEALRRSLDLARSIMERPLREPVPQALIDTVLGTAGSGDKVVPLRRRWMPASPANWALPIAAALALTVGLTVFLGRDSTNIDPSEIVLGPLKAAHPLASVLEQAASGQGVALSGGKETALILATYRDARGRPCREFEILGQETHPVEIGIACREQSGRWNVIGAAEVPADLAINGTFLPAGDQSNDPLQAVLKSISAGAALSPEEEAELIGRQWASSKKS